MVDFRTSRSLTGHHLTPVSAAEALVLALFGHHGFAFPAASSPQFTAFVFGWRVVLAAKKTKTRFILDGGASKESHGSHESEKL